MDLPLNKFNSVIAVLLVGLQITSQLPAKSTRPVTEITSEHSRSDDQYRQYHPGIPFGNPLAGNPKQTRLYAQNQQAMFNAERKRQHRAQLQRWTKAPLQIDSYMKAYHELQENHQMALEQQQIKPVSATMSMSTSKKLQARQVKIKSNKYVGFSTPPPDIIKITKNDAIVHSDKIRNHRSYGSTDHVYHQYLEPKKYQTSVHLSPGTTYDQGVTIKPNGNEGLTHTKKNEKVTKLYTEAIPSKIQYIYPKQYGQMQNYQSAQETDVFNNFLHQRPNHQSPSNDIINNVKSVEEEIKDTLHTPRDLYFYLKDSPKLQDNTHEQITPTYASAYVPYYPETKEYTPIMENIDDIEDPNKHTKLKVYGLQPVLATNAPQEQFVDTTTVKSNNYYKVEVTSQTISAPYKSSNNVPLFYNKEVNPILQTLHYKPAYKDPMAEDSSETYLGEHHNVQSVGIHPLSDDGSGVSTYGDGNLHYAANYEFGYRVRDDHAGNYYGHRESKQGDETRGHYHVLLPDGRMQQVQYLAGPEGFHADVIYDHLQ